MASSNELTAKEMEKLALECVSEFGTANIHAVLKIDHNADLTTIDKAIREYLRRNHPDKAGKHATKKSQIINRFKNVFHDAKTFLSYVLCSKVKPFYLAPMDKSILESFHTESQKWKMNIESLTEQNCQLENELAKCRRTLNEKENVLKELKCELVDKSHELGKVREQMDKHDFIVASMRSELQERAGELRQQRAKLKDKEKEFLQVEEDLQVAKRKLEVKQEAIEELKDQLGQVAKVLCKKEETLAAIKFDLREKIAELDQVRSKLNV